MTTSDTATDERWYVQLDSREVQLMTLDQLDEAFQQGLIHENTYLIKVGEEKWQTLADTLGSAEEEEPAVEPEPAPLPAPAAVVQRPSAAAIPAAATRTASTAWPPAATPAAGGWPPVVSAPSSGYAPVTTSSIPPQTQGPRSTVPVVQDLYELDLDAPFKRSRRGVWLFAAAALAVAGSGGYALTRLDAQQLAPVAAATAAPVAAALTPYRPPAAEPKAAPAPAAAPAPEPPKTDSASKPDDGRFSDDMKKALLAADQERTQKKAARSAAPARRAPVKSRGKTRSSGFKGGGSTHDPLNPTL